MYYACLLVGALVNNFELVHYNSSSDSELDSVPGASAARNGFLTIIRVLERSLGSLFSVCVMPCVVL